MSSTVLYLLLLFPLLLFTLWHLTSTLSPPPYPTNLENKRIILLIAHPDDESMFFSPTVQALTKPERGNHVKILCMSTGDSEGLGETRKGELEKAAVTLGIRRKEDVFVLNDERFKDGMKEEWDEKEIARVLASAFAPQLIPGSASHHTRTASGNTLDAKHKRSSSNGMNKNGGQVTTKPSPLTSIPASSVPVNLRENGPTQMEGPKATIDVLLTFDASGISGHPNHKALYHGSKVFLQQLMRGHSGYACPVVLYTLTTTNIIRKYSFILDVLLTQLINLVSSTIDKTKSDGRVVFVSNVSKYMIAREAMVNGHKSQMIWFRWGWISLGRYMVVNDLRKEDFYSSQK